MACWHGVLASSLWLVLVLTLHGMPWQEPALLHEEAASVNNSLFLRLYVPELAWRGSLQAAGGNPRAMQPGGRVWEGALL